MVLKITSSPRAAQHTKPLSPSHFFFPFRLCTPRANHKRVFLSLAALPQPSQSSGKCPVEVNACSLNTETYPGCKARTTLEGLREQFDNPGFWALAMGVTPTASGKLYLVDISQDDFFLQRRRSKRRDSLRALIKSPNQENMKGESNQ